MPSCQRYPSLTPRVVIFGAHALQLLKIFPSEQCVPVFPKPKVQSLKPPKLEALFNGMNSVLLSYTLNLIAYTLLLTSVLYFDNNATSYLCREVADRISSLMQLQFANPSSQHSGGRRARQYVEEARDRILRQVDGNCEGMRADQILFTSGGTEANNLALFGLAECYPGRVLVSAIEHPSILTAAERLTAIGKKVEQIRATSAGAIDLEHLENLLSTKDKDPVSLVSVMGANNETGVLQPVEEVSKLCKAHNALFHCDAVQLLGKGLLSFQQLQLDAMTITAHKTHGPIGVGALVLRNGVEVSPQLFGGFQQHGLRPGTESPILADAFACAVDVALENGDAIERMRFLRDRFEEGILARIPETVVVGGASLRLPHTSSLSFPGIDRQALQVALDLRGVACSTGSACASGSSQPSHVLQGMGLGEAVVRGGVRFSFSRFTTEEEIVQGIEIVCNVVSMLRK